MILSMIFEIIIPCAGTVCRTVSPVLLAVVDKTAPDKTPIIPYKYIVEAVCDKIAAGMAYKGDKWTCKEPYEYWVNIESKSPVDKHPGCMEFMDTVFKKVADDGLEVALDKKYLKKTYNEIARKYERKII